jgi:gamma-glutamyl-gamma-aminobutyrate hydrolase PuuD
MKQAPLIGVTPDIEARPEYKLQSPLYFLDSPTLDALRAAGAAPVMLPHEIERIPRYLSALDGIMVSGGGYQFPHPDLFGEGADRVLLVGVDDDRDRMGSADTKPIGADTQLLDGVADSREEGAQCGEVRKR